MEVAYRLSVDTHVEERCIVVVAAAAAAACFDNPADPTDPNFSDQ